MELSTPKMAGPTYDKIYIKNLTTNCVIGIHEEERKQKQPVIINIVLFADLIRACRYDDIEDTIDYDIIESEILELTATETFLLVERLAELIAELCLKNPKIVQAEVTVEKPQALSHADSAGVTVVRSKIRR